MNKIKKSINEIKLTNSQKEEMFYKINNKKTFNIFRYSYVVILLIMIINIPVNENNMNNNRRTRDNNSIFKYYEFYETIRGGY